MKEIDFVNNIKLKASYGTQGNDNLGNSTPYLDQYEVVPQDGEIGINLMLELNLGYGIE